MHYLPRGCALILSLSLTTEILEISKKSLTKHFSPRWLINQEEYCDRSLFSRALHGLLQRALLKTRCPNEEKKHNVQCPFLLGPTVPLGHAQPELREGLEPRFQWLLRSTEPTARPPQLLSHATVNNYLLTTASCCCQIWAQSAIDLK